MFPIVDNSGLEGPPVATATGGGAPGRIRTCDLPLRRRLLCPLSYGDVAGVYRASASIRPRLGWIGTCARLRIVQRSMRTLLGLAALIASVGGCRTEPPYYGPPGASATPYQADFDLTAEHPVAIRGLRFVVDPSDQALGQATPSLFVHDRESATGFNDSNESTWILHHRSGFGQVLGARIRARSCLDRRLGSISAPARRRAATRHGPSSSVGCRRDLTAHSRCVSERR